MRKKEINMLSGPITPCLISVSIPIIITNVVQALFSLIDMTILKANGAGDAIGAVGASTTLINLFTGLVIGIATGANIIIAKSIGSKDSASVSRGVGTAVAFSALAGLLLTLIGVAGAPLFLQWTNCPATLMDNATLYFRLYFAGVPLLMIYNFCAAVLRSAGDSRKPMVFLVLGSAVKMLLTLLFVAKLQLGIRGVAFATIISWGLSAFLSVIALLMHHDVIRLNPKTIGLHKNELIQMLKVGLPAGLQQALYSIANVLITATVNSFGEAATTGMSIANNIDGILYYICTGVSFAVIPYVSQNVGCGNIKRAAQSLWRGLGLTAAFGITFGALFVIFSENLARLMTDDPQVIAYAQHRLFIIASTYFLCGINDTLCGALRSMGKSVTVTVCALFFLCIIRFVWVYLFFPLVPHLSFLYAILPIGWVLSSITLLFILFPTAKKLQNAYN